MRPTPTRDDRAGAARVIDGDVVAAGLAGVLHQFDCAVGVVGDFVERSDDRVHEGVVVFGDAVRFDEGIDHEDVDLMSISAFVSASLTGMTILNPSRRSIGASGKLVGCSRGSRGPCGRYRCVLLGASEAKAVPYVVTIDQLWRRVTQVRLQFGRLDSTGTAGGSDRRQYGLVI
jgi:hypothetical protein